MLYFGHTIAATAVIILGFVSDEKWETNKAAQEE